MRRAHDGPGIGTVHDRLESVEGMLLKEGDRFKARVARQCAISLHDTERDQIGRHPDLVHSASGYGSVPVHGGRAADLGDAQARLLKGRMMDVVNVLGRDAAMYRGGSWVTAEETRLVINPADQCTCITMASAHLQGSFPSRSEAPKS